MSSIKTGLIALITVLIIIMAAKAFAEEPQYRSNMIPEDVILFRSDFSNKSVADFIQKVYLHQGDTLAIWIDSPGGSVFALEEMVQAVKSTGKPVVCVASFAASAAFMAFESMCDVRAVQPSSKLMSHQAAYGLRGERNRLISFQGLIEAVLLRLDTLAANTLGITVDALRTKSADEWWMTGHEAVEQKAADSVELFLCSPEMLSKSYTEIVRVMMFSFEVEWSECPLITAPLSVELMSKEGEGPIPSLDARTRFLQNKDYYIRGAFFTDM